ncbi:MAG TPA: universal stress protein [Jatrophihabitans sp.]|nr:universal stress protein [Jatrophihabitans sp.]
MTSTEPGRPVQRIVIGVDGSEQSIQALRWARRLAADIGARLEAVLAWEYPMITGWGTAAMPLTYNLHADMEKVLTDAVDTAFGADRPADLRLDVLEGHPARLLIERSADALMLVLGSRGHGGFTGLLLGSISANVAEHAHCPVLVVHGDRLPDAR